MISENNIIEQNRIIQSLQECGIAISHVSKLFSPQDIENFSATEQYFLRMAQSKKVKARVKTIKRTTKPFQHVKDRGKFYEITQFEYLRRGLNLKDGVIQLYLSDTLLHIAKTYLNNPDIRLFNVLTWIHPPSAAKECFASQFWHRDFEDHHNLKLFIYFSDVDENSGALEYYKHSATGKKYAHIDQKDAAARISSDDYVRASGPKGTLVFVDTTGIHKGGFIKNKTRIITHGIYLGHNAKMIRSGYFSSFNYNNKINKINFKSTEYQNLSESAKQVLGGSKKH
tara:strand:+ start:3519 stop:4370 length:852 start_codon:yes stop_codon:yes gene_type:complete